MTATRRISAKKYIYTFVLPVLLGVVFLSNPLFGQVDSSRLTFTLMTGDILLQKPNSDGWIKAGPDSSFGVGDNIRTKKESNAEIHLGDTQYLRIAPMTIISVDSVLYKDRVPVSFRVIINSGDVWGDLKKKGNSTRLDIQSGPINTNIENGIFRISVGADGTTELKIYEGTASIEHSADSASADTLTKPKALEHSKPDSAVAENITAWKASLGPMEKLIVTAKGKIVYTGKFSPDDIDEKSEWVDWNKKRDLH